MCILCSTGVEWFTTRHWPLVRPISICNHCHQWQVPHRLVLVHCGNDDHLPIDTASHRLSTYIRMLLLPSPPTSSARPLPEHQNRLLAVPQSANSCPISGVRTSNTGVIITPDQLLSILRHFSFAIVRKICNKNRQNQANKAVLTFHSLAQSSLTTVSFHARIDIQRHRLVISSFK